MFCERETVLFIIVSCLLNGTIFSLVSGVLQYRIRNVFSICEITENNGSQIAVGT